MGACDAIVVGEHFVLAVHSYAVARRGVEVLVRRLGHEPQEGDRVILVHVHRAGRVEVHEELMEGHGALEAAVPAALHASVVRVELASVVHEGHGELDPADRVVRAVDHVARPADHVVAGVRAVLPADRAAAVAHAGREVLRLAVDSAAGLVDADTDYAEMVTGQDFGMAAPLDWAPAAEALDYSQATVTPFLFHYFTSQSIRECSRAQMAEQSENNKTSTGF